MPSKKKQNTDQLSRRSLSAAKVFAVRLLLFAIVCLTMVSGALEPLNMSLMDMRFRLLQRPPSDTLVVVEIDPYSLQEEARWPWPRDRYATAITNLQGAGASLIAFDVDFSALSDEAGDAAFAEALSRRPGEVILPVFAQKSSRSERDSNVIQTPPNSYFLQDVVVASVNLTTEKNGLIRRGWMGFEDNNDDFRGSVAAVLAGVPGARRETFYIDYGVDPASIQRLSFSDVLKGEFPREAVKGKKVLIGSTALELGDEFAAPVWGITPGVMFHAMSYESLLQERALKRLHYCIPLLAAFVVIIWLSHPANSRHFKTAALRHVLLFGTLIGAPALLQYLTPISLDVGAILAAQGVSIIYVTAFRLRRYAGQIIRQRAATAHYQALTGLVVRDNTDGVIVANAIGVIELSNDRAQRLLGADVMTPGSNILDHAEDFPLFPLAELSAPHQNEQRENGQATHSEFVVKNNDNLVLEVVASCSSPDIPKTASPESPARSRLFVYTLRDISARKRIEAAEREAKEAAIAADKMKSELISNMSHELRTPLNGVIGFADILQKESFGPIGVPEYKEYSENIYVSGKRLLNLVNDMLNIAKLDADSYELCKDAMSMSEVIEHCVDTFQSRTKQDASHIKIDIQKDMPTLNVDLGVFNEIFCHLLSNATKYAGDEGCISIRAAQDKNDLILEFEDNGGGVSPEHLPKLTDAFYQADGALNRQHEGAGLGLYLTSKFTALHGGVLELESKEGEGFLARLRFVDIVAEAHRSAA
ncbi:MAG: CHASE2 domain-containing protein [Pseudomonadota bacterium]